MIIAASQKYIRVSSQKVKFVADSIKHFKLSEMRTQLGYLNNQPARKILMTLNQALANAQHNFGLGIDQLSLESLLILRGPQYKRQRARSRGQGHPILKRTSHIVIKLKAIEKRVETRDESNETKEQIEKPKKVTVKKVKKVAKGEDNGTKS